MQKPFRRQVGMGMCIMTHHARSEPALPRALAGRPNLVLSPIDVMSGAEAHADKKSRLGEPAARILVRSGQAGRNPTAANS